MKFAPLRVPLNRRLQTCAIVGWTLVMPFFIILIAFLVRYYTLLMVGYGLWIFLDQTPVKGGRKWEWVRQWTWWKYMRDFFPVSLVKTHDLDPSKKYLFGYHPHGIIGLGAWVNFITEGNDFSLQFPGLDFRVCTLNTNFRIPLYREFLLSLGLVSVARESVNHILRLGPGNAVMIVVGGAREALVSKPGTNDLILLKRQGFIKIALMNGASLVPVMSFGENDLFDQVENPPGSLLWRFQQLFTDYFSFSPPLIKGRGIFTYNWGLLPFRRQVVSVVGKPIDCPEIKDPTPEQIRLYQELYVAELHRIYDENKDKYARERKSSLRIIE
ncbi:diacylglycerol acyltransferase [Gorgonomyces haynaldii]|nr:diacylglycerol acyltransferase [Gorgonomyces haynaldii]